MYDVRLEAPFVQAVRTVASSGISLRQHVEAYHVHLFGCLVTLTATEVAMLVCVSSRYQLGRLSVSSFGTFIQSVTVYRVASALNCLRRYSAYYVVRN